MARVTLVLAGALVLAGLALLFWPEGSSRHADSPQVTDDRPLANISVDAVVAGPLRAPSDECAGTGQVADPGKDEEEDATYERDDVVEKLEQSSDAEHLLVAAMLVERDDPAAALELLTRAGRIDPGNAIVAGKLLGICAGVSLACELSLPALERALVLADRDNAIAWARIVHSRAQRNDVDGALAALRHVAAAPDVDASWVEYVQLWDRALAAASDLPAYDRLVAAIGVAGAQWHPASGVLDQCDLRAEGSGEWLDVCTRAGELFASRGRSLMTKNIGLRLQKDMYELAGNHAAGERILAQRDELSQQYALLGASAAGIEWDAQLVYDWLEVYAASDESSSMAFAVDESQGRLAAGGGVTLEACQDP